MPTSNPSSARPQRGRGIGFYVIFTSFLTIGAYYLYQKVYSGPQDTLDKPKVQTDANSSVGSISASSDTSMIQRSHKTAAVIGAGLAGVTAASELLRRDPDIRVVLIDKNSTYGGNSSKATSGINASATKYQSISGIADGIDLFMDDIIRSGKGLADHGLAHILATRSASAVEGVELFWSLSLSDIGQLGGASAPRCHRIPKGPDGRSPPVGFSIISAGVKYLKSECFADRFQLMLNTSFSSMDIDSEGQVTQLHLTTAPDPSQDPPPLPQSIHLPVDIVIIASGGYSNAPDLVKSFSPSKAGHPTTNGWFAQGDMLRWGLNEGGFEGRDLDQIQLHPTGFVNPSDPLNAWTFLCPEIMRGSGARLVNRQGHRFIDELETRDTVSNAIEALEETATKSYAQIFGDLSDKCKEDGPSSEGCDYNMAGIILTHSEAEAVGASSVAFYRHKALLTMVHSLSELATKMNIPETNLTTALTSSAPGGKEVTRSPSEILSDTPFYYGYVTPSLHYTMGGLRVDTTSRPISKNGLPSPNLFVIGEAAGGVHGANRLGGNGCLESLVFGGWSAQMATCKADDRVVVEVLATDDGSHVSEIVFLCPLHVDLISMNPYAIRILTSEERPVSPDFMSTVESHSDHPRASIHGRYSLCTLKPIGDGKGLSWGTIRPGDKIEMINEVRHDEL